MSSPLSTVAVSMLRNARDVCLDVAEGCETLLERLTARPSSQRRPRAADSPGGTADQAPFAELVSAPAARLIPMIRELDDLDLLRRAHEFELSGRARDGVLSELEQQCKRLGSPLGGPPEPLEHYEELELHDIVSQLISRREDPEFAARVFAYESYRLSRPTIIERAGEIAGQRGPELVKESSPRAARRQLAPPFPGYDELNATPQHRQVVRETLQSKSPRVLRRALYYEAHTRNRKVMIAAIERALKDAASENGQMPPEQPAGEP